MKYCQNCGMQVNDTDQFCANCGCRFAEASPEPSRENVSADQEKPVKNMAGKVSPMSIVAFILALLGCTSLIGLILGIVDAVKKDGRKKGLSVAAIIIGALVTLSSLIVIPVGFVIMGPSLGKYTEKTNVSSDTQLADSVKTALTTALMDPLVIANDSSTVNQILATGYWADITTIGSASDINKTDTVRGAFNEIMGVDTTDVAGLIKSHHEPDAKIMYRVTNGNSISVLITTTDRTGGKRDDPEYYICTDPSYSSFDDDSYIPDEEFFHDDLDDVYFDDDIYFDDDDFDDEFDFD